MSGRMTGRFYVIPQVVLTACCVAMAGPLAGFEGTPAGLSAEPLRGRLRRPAAHRRDDRHRQRARRPDVARPVPALLEPVRRRRTRRHHVDLDEGAGPARRHPVGARRLRAGAAEPAEARSRLSRRRRHCGRWWLPGQPGYGMAAVGAGKTTPGAELILRAAEQRRPAAAVGARLGRHEHAGAGARRPPARRARRTQLEAIVSKLRVYAISDQDDAGPWLRREFPSLRYIVTPSTQDGEEYYFATWTGISGDRFYQQRARRRLHDLHRRVGQREHPEQGAAREALSLSLLHPRGRHAVVPRPHRQRPRQRHEPGLRRLGRTLRVAPAVAARRARSGRRAATRSRAATARATRWSAPTAQAYTSDQATIWRWRTAFQHDFAARMDWTIKAPAEANHNPRVVVNGRPGTEPLVLDAQVGTAARARCRGDHGPGRARAEVLVVLLPRGRHRDSRTSRSLRRQRSAAAGAAPAGRRHAARAARRPARAAAAPRDRERDRARERPSWPKARRHRPRDSRRRGRRHAQPDVVPARHPEHESGCAGRGGSAAR